MALLNGYKTSGTFASTASWQNLYTFSYTSSGCRGFITVTGQVNGPSYGMITAFFEGTLATSYATLTQIACSGNGAGASKNTSGAIAGGTQTIFLQLINSASAPTIQVKTTSYFNVNWFIIFL